MQRYRHLIWKFFTFFLILAFGLGTFGPLPSVIAASLNAPDARPLMASVTEKWGECPDCDYTGVTGDTYIDEAQTTYNMGATTLIRAGDNDGSRAVRILIQFDFSNIDITSSSQITSATLHLRNNDYNASGDHLGVYRVKKDWVAGSTDYSTADDAADEVTWRYQAYDETAWSSWGCDGTADRESSPEETEIIDSQGTWYSWDVTNSAKTMYDNNEYYGWILFTEEEGDGSQNKIRFYSSEHTNNSSRPYLKITYNESPTPTPTDTPTPTPTPLPGSDDWWDDNYQYSQQITLSAPASKAVPSGYLVRLEFNHSSLVADSKSLSNGDDLRVAYWNGSGWDELDRVLFDNNKTSSQWNQTDTQIMFKTQASISGGGSDNNYYLFYGYTSATSPPTDTLSSRYFLADSLSETQTSSTSYSTKTTLQFTPSSINEHWVVVATWRQREVGNLGTESYLGRGRITLNGTPRTGTEDISFCMSGDIWKTFQAILKITGENTQQSITIDFRSQGGTDAIDNARILAFMIPDPSSADIQYSETLATSTDSTNPTDAQTLTFTPSSAGDYIWMANGYLHEAPGGASNGGLFAEDENSTDQQQSYETYIGGGDPDVFVPMIHMEKRSLSTSSQTFTIRHQPDTNNGGSERQGLTQLLFRSDVFDGAEVDDSAGQSTTSSQSYQSKVSLTTASQGADHDYVYLVSMMQDDASDSGSITLSTFAEIRLAGTQQLEDEKAIGRSDYPSQIAWAWAETTSGSRTVDARFKAESGVTTQTKYAHITSLRYIEPGTSLGSEEANVTAGTTGSQTASLDIPSTNQYVGGTFSLAASSARTVTAITIKETGTVDASLDLSNIELYYENDTASPYDCADESYAGTETQFGSTDADGFSAADGTSSFSGSVAVSTTSTMCVYVVLDVGSGASDAETLLIEINDPSSDVSLSAGSVGPETVVALTGSTSLSAPDTPTPTPYGEVNVTNITFPETTLDGSQQIIYDNSANNWQVTSTYAAGTSWHVDISSTDFTDGSDTIDVSNFEVQLLDANISGSDKPASQITSYTPLSTTDQQLLAYSGSNGKDTFDYNPDFKLVIAADTYIGSYSATVTVTFVVGP